MSSTACDTSAAPDIVWSRLIHASGWPAIYANASKVKVEGGGDLVAGARFTWKTFGIALEAAG